MKSKFKVGDKVTIVDKYRNKYNSIVGVGEVICITPTNNRLLYTVRFKDKAFEPAFYSYELNLYNPTFKVGDKVKLSEKAIRFLKNVYPQSHMLQGKTYIIESIYAVGENNINLRHVRDYAFDKSDLILVQEEGETEYNDNEHVSGYNRRFAMITNWNNICDRYLIEFCKKHEFSIDYEYDIDKGYAWVGGDRGTIANVCDMFISMEDIRYDVDNDIPEEKFQEWYWKNLEHYEFGLKYMNYRSYCKGAPEPYTDEQLQNIKDARTRVQQSKVELEKIIGELGGDVEKMLY